MPKSLSSGDVLTLAARMKLMEKRQNQGIYIPRHSRLPSSRQGSPKHCSRSPSRQKHD